MTPIRQDCGLCCHYQSMWHIFCSNTCCTSGPAVISWWCDGSCCSKIRFSMMDYTVCLNCHCPIYSHCPAKSHFHFEKKWHIWHGRLISVGPYISQPSDWGLGCLVMCWVMMMLWCGHMLCDIIVMDCLYAANIAARNLVITSGKSLPVSPPSLVEFGHGFRWEKTQF